MSVTEGVASVTLSDEHERWGQSSRADDKGATTAGWSREARSASLRFAHAPSGVPQHLPPLASPPQIPVPAPPLAPASAPDPTPMAPGWPGVPDWHAYWAHMASFAQLAHLAHPALLGMPCPPQPMTLAMDAATQQPSPQVRLPPLPFPPPLMHVPAAGWWPAFATAPPAASALPQTTQSSHVQLPPLFPDPLQQTAARAWHPLRPPGTPPAAHGDMRGTALDARAANEFASVPPCVECQARPAQWTCEQCGDDYCKSCFASLHRAGRRAAHTWRVFQPYDLRLRHASAVRIQRVVRGMLARRVWVPRLVETQLRLQRVLTGMVDELVAEHLQARAGQRAAGSLHPRLHLRLRCVLTRSAVAAIASATVATAHSAATAGPAATAGGTGARPAHRGAEPRGGGLRAAVAAIPGSAQRVGGGQGGGGGGGGSGRGERGHGAAGAAVHVRPDARARQGRRRGAVGRRGGRGGGRGGTLLVRHALRATGR